LTAVLKAQAQQIRENKQANKMSINANAKKEAPARHISHSTAAHFHPFSEALSVAADAGQSAVTATPLPRLC
jgi:hypothetical protein